MTLRDFFEINKRLALAFSGGVDSAYLFYAGLSYGCDITAYYVRTEFQPQFEYEDANKLVSDLRNMGYEAKMKTIELSVLSEEDIADNPVNRCYYCKKRIFESIINEANSDGYRVVIDGTNASDDVSERPGMKAVSELSVKSPLRECSITKDEVRILSKEAGLFTWNKPSYACLATRVEHGEVITKEKLTLTENAEAYMRDTGFSDFRIRMKDNGDTAVIELRDSDRELYFIKKDEIQKELAKYYKNILLNEAVHR